MNADAGVVLGIDAAWTAGRPSGVALVRQQAGRWCLCAVAPSYDHFLSLGRGDEPRGAPAGSIPDVAALLDAAAEVAVGDALVVDRFTRERFSTAASRGEEPRKVGAVDEDELARGRVVRIWNLVDQETLVIRIDDVEKLVGILLRPVPA